MKRILFFIICAFVIFSTTGKLAAQTTIGNYPATTVTAGQCVTVTPDFVSNSVYYLVGNTSATFTGTISADLSTGAIRIVDAAPAGTYTITVYGIGPLNETRTFVLTVNNPGCSQGEFISGGNFVTGSAPRGVAVGDFNGDGNLDYATANPSSNDISVRLGNGSGGFGANANYAAGTYPTNLAVGDINGDGKQDILVTNSMPFSSAISVKLGDGTGGFPTTTTIPFGPATSPYGIVIGDFNSDRKKDYATVCAGLNCIYVGLGDGLGGFGIPTNYGPIPTSYSLATGDFNQDGIQDIVTANVSSNNISVFLGNGTGGFPPPSSFTVGSNPYSVCVGDFNSDGKQDIATANNASNNISILTGDGSGNFSAPNNFNSSMQPYALTPGDFNGDGNQDIAVAKNGTNQLSFHLGNGLGSFGAPFQIGIDANSTPGIAIGDFNSDGLEDCIATCATNTVWLVKGAANEINVKGNNVSIASGDLVPSTLDHTDFGSVYTCSGNVVRTFTVENTGNINLSTSGIMVSGGNAGDFSILSIPAGTIAPGSSSTFQISFDPSAVGLRSTHLYITNNDCNEGFYDFMIQGTGTADVTPPVALCQNLSVRLSPSGTALLIPAMLDNGSYDDCGIASRTVNPSVVTCANVGPVNVTLTVTDASGNSSSCTSVVTVIDTVRPVVSCHPATVYFTSSGDVTLAPNLFDGGSSDPCGIASMSVSPDYFNCSNPVANYPVTFSVVDVNGNTATCATTVNVFDGLSPVALTHNITLYLDANGEAWLSAPQVDNGSYDECGIVQRWISTTHFTCADTGANTITFRVFDSFGNVGESHPVVTVLDTIRPTVTCQNVTVTLTSSGSVNVLASQLITASNDNCSIAYQNISQPVFTCSQIGLNTVTVTVSDPSGNSQTCSSTVTVLGTLGMTISADSNVSCHGGANGGAHVVASGGSGIYTYSWSPSGGTAAAITGLAAGNYTCTVTDNNGCSVAATVTITEPATFPVASSGSTLISCNGGNSTVTVSASGGTTPYSGTGNFVRTAGTYSFTVTDANGCVATTSVSITEPTQLTASSSATAVLCNGGNSTVTVSASGGTTPYSGTGSFVQTAGTYSFTVTDANGCVATSSVSITEPVLLTATSSATSILCNGGNSTVTISASGGTTPYSGTGSFVHTAGTYSFTVTDANGCVATTSVSITEPVLLTATSSATSILCNGGNSTITVSASGGTASYSGDGNFTQTAGAYSFTVTDANGCTATTTISITEPTAISTSVASVNVSCNGGNNGSIDLTVSGGTSPYSFDWNNGTYLTEDLSGLSAGSYSGVLTDANGCTDAGTVVITEPAALTANASASAILCNGGSSTVTITASGGISPYSGTGISTEAAGNYSYIVTDANGCTITTTISITEPTTISTSIASVNVSCNGGNNGSIDLTVTGGTQPYSFDWNNGTYITEDITSLSAGSYSGVLTDANGCTDAGTVIITEPPVLNAAITSTTHPTTCGGTNGAIDITVTGGTPGYNYLWSTTATTEDVSGLAAGTYNCTITDANNCTTTTGSILNDPAPPAVTFDLLQTLICVDNAAVTLNGELPTGGTFSGPGVTGTSFDPMTAGAGMQNIIYTYTDTNGCTGSATDSITVDLCMGIIQSPIAVDFLIYPNPNNGQFSFTQNRNETCDVLIYDAMGRLVNSFQALAHVAYQLDLESSGIYTVTAVTSEGDRLSQRVIVNR